MTEYEYSMPIVSVIIPLYNKAPFIKRALDSVLAQTVPNFEVIVVGGLSSDGGEDIVKEYVDPRIHFIQESGTGVSAARNQGVDVAKAELIAFLDADDEWKPTFLETILSLRAKYPDGGCYATKVIMDKPSKKLYVNNLSEISLNFIGPIENIFYVAAKMNTFPGHTSSTMVSKSIFLDDGGFLPGAKIAEDVDLWARISLKYPYIYTSSVQAIYHQDCANSVTRDFDTYLQNYPPFLQSIKKYSDGWLKMHSYYADLQLYLEKLKISAIQRYIFSGKSQQARHELKEIQHIEFKKQKIMLFMLSFLPHGLIVAVVKKLYF